MSGEGIVRTDAGGQDGQPGGHQEERDSAGPGRLVPALGLATFLAMCVVVLLLSGPFWGAQILDNALIQALCAPFIGG